MSFIMYLHTLSPLHTGTGQGTGIIDLPIARETVTNWPEIPGSSLKGALRTAAEAEKGKPYPVKEIFGPELSAGDDPAASSGRVWFGVGRILFFPVRSYSGTFAWVTCPLALRSWARDLETVGIPAVNVSGLSLQTGEIAILEDSDLKFQNTVLLEDLDFTPVANANAQGVATTLASLLFKEDDWKKYFLGHFAVVSDDVFTFLVTMATTVSTRIKLEDETKTVQDGAMWYEETIPPEAIFWSPLAGEADSYAADLKRLVTTPFQLGGNATVGQGLIQANLHWAGGDEA